MTLKTSLLTEKGGHLETNLAADLNVERKVITDLITKEANENEVKISDRWNC